MAARLNAAHQADVRLKIKTSQLVNRLQDFALGGTDPKTDQPIEIDSARLKAIEILLRKSLPDLSSVALSGAGENGEHLHKVSADDAFATFIAAMGGNGAAPAGRDTGAGEVEADSPA
jgi:hypothetical protein